MLEKGQRNTAILVFAHSGQAESEHKAIPNGDLLYDTLTQRTINIVRKTGLPYFHLTETNQIGLSFGERFTNAIQTVFDKGFDKIISIGNDTPQLNASHILEATEHLENGRIVLGPSADGGFYLLAIHKSQFDVSNFQELSWKTSHLFNETSAMLSGQGHILIQLHTFVDLDNTNDLKLFLKQFHTLSKELLQIIHAILNPKREIVRAQLLFFNTILSNTFLNKGSPFVPLS